MVTVAVRVRVEDWLGEECLRKEHSSKIQGALGLGLARTAVGVRAGVRNLRKEHSSKSDWSSRESSFVGETLGGDLVGLGYGQGRGEEEGREGVGVGVGKRARARVDAMYGAVNQQCSHE